LGAGEALLWGRHQPLLQYSDGKGIAQDSAAKEVDAVVEESKMGGSASVISLEVTDKAQNFGESIENNERDALE
jgi:hypothetical protein